MTTSDPLHNAPEAARPVLQVKDVDVWFGGVPALAGLDFEVRAGELLGLIGPNGAGKTTIFNVITGLVAASSGDVVFDGEALSEKRPDQVAGLGLARTFQHLALVPELTVRQNVLIGAHRHGRIGWLRAGLGIGVGREERALHERAERAMERMGLLRISERACSSLGLPMLKLVEIARAIASEPRMLLLDEPANGLTHGEVRELGESILRIREEDDMTVVLVEHHMGLVRHVADRLVVMNFGSKIAEGSPGEVLESSEVIEAYLGGAGK